MTPVVLVGKGADDMPEKGFKAVMTEPSVYALLLSITSINTTYLWSGIAYTFEEAYERAKHQFLHDNEDTLEEISAPVISTPAVLLMRSEQLESALEDFGSFNGRDRVKAEEPAAPAVRVRKGSRKPAEETKSGLMQRIIASGSKKLYELYKDKFTDEERKLINESCKWV